MAIEISAQRGLREDFDRDGFCVVRGVFAPHEVEAIKAHFEELHGRGSIPGCFTSNPDSEDPLEVYPRLMHPHRQTEFAKQCMIDPRIMDVLETLLGEEPIAAQSMYYFKPPGARGQALHQDNFYLKVEPGTCIAAWVAIDRADEENGGLVVVPGSQGMDVVCPEPADPTVSFSKHFVRPPAGLKEHAVVLEPGDVLFFNGSVIHGSYPNRSRDRFRRSFICHYAGISCEKIGKHYQPLYRRDGTALRREDAQGAGPCGEEFEVSSPH